MYSQKRSSTSVNLTWWTLRIAVLVVVIALPFLLDLRIISHLRSRLQYGGKSSLERRPNVTVWYPTSHNCRGIFNDEPADDGIPLVLLRDVLVDKRHPSVQEYRINQPDSGHFRRLVGLLTVPPKGRIHVNSTTGPDPINPATGDPDAAKAHLRLPHGGVPGDFRISVDYVITNPSCASQCKQSFCAVKEWQVIMTLTSSDRRLSDESFERNLELLEMSGGQVHLELPMRLSEEPVRVFKSSFNLGCVAGLTRSTDLLGPAALPPLKHTCADTHGAIMLGGGALVREKKWSESGWAEVGNFAARAMRGQVRFDAVAVAVTVKYTVSHMRHICKNVTKCFDRLHEENRQLLDKIAERAREEMESVEVPPSMWPNLYILPFCRLGSDYMEHEKNNPCRWSHYHGQYHQSTYLYSLLGSHYKYAASLDIDEFLVDRYPPGFSRFPLGQSRLGAQSFSAERRFDSVGETSDPNVFWFRWLDFQLRPGDERSLTNTIMARKEPSFLSMNETNLNVSSCYGSTITWSGGKTVVSCDRGMGFRIHNAVMISQRNNLSSLVCNSKSNWGLQNDRFTSMFIYHGRRTPRYGNCLFDSSAV